eukprot:m.354514 g.354514  ORF g.354514 m.354514 type:complete len:256 (+) comp17039_c0_seq1:165-932(+)
MARYYWSYAAWYLALTGIMLLASQWLFPGSLFAALQSQTFLAGIAIVVYCPVQWNVLPIISADFWIRHLGRFKAMFWFTWLVVACTAIRVMLFKRVAAEDSGSFDFPTSEMERYVTQVIAPAMKWYGVLVSQASVFQLGLYGTYMGEYFNICLSTFVYAFPFNHISNPMYMGTFLAHLGESVALKSVNGVLLSIIFYGVMRCALAFEIALMDSFYKSNVSKAVKMLSGWDVRAAFMSREKQEEYERLHMDPAATY